MVTPSLNKEAAVMDPANFQELYKTELQEACSLETQLVQALPKMAESAHDPNLKRAILSHLDETRGHEWPHGPVDAGNDP